MSVPKRKTILAISGYSRAGKDAFGSDVLSIISSVFKGDVITGRYKIAETLRDAVALALARLKIERSAWTEEQMEKEKLRPVLVALGKYARDYDPDVFINASCDIIEEDLKSYVQLAVVTDMRYHNEYLCLRALAEKNQWDFHWVHIIRTGLMPANITERESIAELRSRATPESLFMISDGDLHCIRTCAGDYVKAHLR